jgi:hypothetical protein
VDQMKLRAARELVWHERHCLNELANRPERQLDERSRPVCADGTGLWIGAPRDIGQSESETVDLIINLQALLEHIQRRYAL